jgi:hypothetical protein
MLPGHPVGDGPGPISRRCLHCLNGIPIVDLTNMFMFMSVEVCCCHVVSLSAMMLTDLLREVSNRHPKFPFLARKLRNLLRENEMMKEIIIEDAMLCYSHGLPSKEDCSSIIHSQPDTQMLAQSHQQKFQNRWIAVMCDTTNRGQTQARNTVASANTMCWRQGIQTRALEVLKEGSLGIPERS